MFRSGLLYMLGTQPSIKIVGDVSSLLAAFPRISSTKPDMLCTDLEFGDAKRSPIPALRSIRKEFPRLKILVISYRSNPTEVAELVELGIHGYLTKGCPPEELIRAIQDISSDNTYFCADVTKALFQFQRQKKTFKLTQRQKDVLKLAARGLTTTEIASQLCLSPKTVENYRYHILKKMDAKNILQALQIAVKEELIEL